MSNLNTIRTDVVGSLLRPAAVIEARKKFDAGRSARQRCTRSRMMPCVVR